MYEKPITNERTDEKYDKCLHNRNLHTPGSNPLNFQLQLLKLLVHGNAI